MIERYITSGVLQYIAESRVGVVGLSSRVVGAWTWIQIPHSASAHAATYQVRKHWGGATGDSRVASAYHRSRPVRWRYSRLWEPEAPSDGLDSRHVRAARTARYQIVRKIRGTHTATLSPLFSAIWVVDHSSTLSLHPPSLSSHAPRLDTS